MSVTKRFLIIYAASVPIILLAMTVGLAVFAFLACNLICAGLITLDYFLTPSPQSLDVARAGNGKLFWGVNNELAFTVRNNSRHDLTVELKDVSDRHFAVKSTDMAKTVPSSGEAEFAYTVNPAKRGSFVFAEVYARYVGVLGLCEKHAVFNAKTDYKVYPDVTDLSKYRLALQRHRNSATNTGRLREAGAGKEFESLREYVQGDDYRKINWMATARENKLIVNSYESERNRPVYIMLDTGRPLSYNARGYKKLDYAVNAALILSDIVNENGDNCGLVVFNTEVGAVVPPGKGQAHRMNIMDALYHASDSRNTSDYGKAVRTLLASQKRRSLVFIFTDFDTEEEADALAESLAVLKTRHVPIVTLMRNDGLHEMTEAGDEMGRYRRVAAQEYVERKKKIIRRMNARGIFCMESGAERFALGNVNAYLGAFGRSGAGG